MKNPSKRSVTIHYDRVQIDLGEATTPHDVDGWLDNLAARIGDEFNAEVTLSNVGTWGCRSTCSPDSDVDARLREIVQGDEWISLLPNAREAT